VRRGYSLEQSKYIFVSNVIGGRFADLVFQRWIGPKLYQQLDDLLRFFLISGGFWRPRGRDGAVKLNELIAATPGASSPLLNIEDISEHQLHILHRHYAELAHLAKQEHDLTKSHSLEEANRRHSKKSGAGKEAQQ